MSVQLSFLGAADTVSGSRTFVTYRGKRWLIDCGLFQGPKIIRDRNRERFTPHPSELDGIILTHAHLDHSGYLPKICREGFSGPILATEGTMRLCGVLLRDAAKLEEEAAAYANKTGYSNHNPAIPLFTEEDVDKALEHFKVCSRQQWINLGEGLAVRFLRAGHIIGASMVQLSFDLGAGPRLVTFSGDLGNHRSHVLRGPESLHETDALILESTYGDRLQPRTNALEALAAVVNRTAAREGVLVIPAFAVGRAQELTYMFRLLEDQKQIPQLPIILDSPMAAAAMSICLSLPEDQVLESAFHRNDNPFFPRFFEVSATPDESMLACMRSGPMVVISASGMLNGGRILHHLKRRLPDRKNTVLFTGYQAEGSKGRYLQEEGAAEGVIRIHKAEVPIEAEVVTLDHLSAHADQQDLLEFVGNMKKLPRKILLNHGSPEAQQILAQKLKERFGVDAQPVNGTETIMLPLT